MIWSLLVPAAAAVAACLSIGSIHRRLPPRAATWLLTLLIVGATLAVLWAVAMVAFGFVVQRLVPWLEFGWCRTLYRRHDHVPTTLGVLAVGSLAVMAAGGWRARRRYRRYASLPGEPIEIVPTSTPMAMTLPGRFGRIVVSTGMLGCLEADERRVLFAHEHAHVRHRHYRFLAIADLAASALPVLRPVRRQLRHATERWADETAAAELGDRRLVARAIARAALASDAHTPAGALGMASSGVPARVEALLRPSSVGDPDATRWLTAGVAAGAVALIGAGIQLHHLVAFALHIC